LVVYKFKAAIPWRVALTKDDWRKSPGRGAPWRPDGSMQCEGDTKFMCVPLKEVPPTEWLFRLGPDAAIALVAYRNGFPPVTAMVAPDT
jgi:hypothetical protein